MMTSEASGQRLMSVWQGVAMLDPGHSASRSTARKASVQDVTRTLARDCPTVRYSDRVFMDNFPNSSIDFNDYVNYVKVCLRDHCTPMSDVEDVFELKCWEMCKDCYSLHHCSLTEDEVFKIWQIFNRLCVQGTIPPVMEYDDVQWLGQKFAQGAKQRWSSFHDGQLTFMEVLLDLDSVCFKVLAHKDVERVVDSVHGWLVREVLLTGWMSKRTRKQANWTPWRKRWFVLKPGVLSYYTSPTLAEKKGDILLTSKSRVDDLEDLKTLIRHYPNRFRITNAPFIEIELSNEEYSMKDAWMRVVKMTIKASKVGVSPSEYMLTDIRKMQRGERLSTFDLAAPTRRITSMTGNRGTSSGIDDEYEDDTDGVRLSTASRSTGNFDDDSDFDQERVERTSEEGTWIIPVVMAQITQAAKMMGTEDGQMDNTAFTDFLGNLGILISEDNRQSLFEMLYEDDLVNSDVFIEYMLKVLLFTKVLEDSLTQNFFFACIKAYDSNAKLNLQAFCEALWRKQRVIYVHQMMGVLDGLDGQTEDTISQLRNAFSREQSVLGTTIDERELKDTDFEQLLRRNTHVNVEQLAQFLHMAWTESRPHRIAHEKTLLDLAFEIRQETEEVGAPPDITRVAMFTWKRASKQGKNGSALLATDFDGKVAMAEATAEALSYYGVSIIAEIGQLHTSLLYEHIIVNYRKPEDDHEYALCFNKQDVPALLCPLEDNTGMLLLGKQEGDMLDLNAFSIPRYQTVYIPRSTIVCTNYMVGMWRTMVIKRAHTELALVAQMDEEGQIKAKNTEFFKFV